jgi:LuxR family maltose regulon positive regulatory protein
VLNYISVREAAENWGISERRVQKLCEQDRVPGAQRFGHFWMLPEDSQKPEDRRLTPNSVNSKCVVPRPGVRNPLPMLRMAWKLKIHGHDEQFDALLDELFPIVKSHKDEPELYGEWLLLSSFKHHPHLSEMNAVLKQAEPYFKGKCSRVILPSSLFPFANFSLFSTYHTEPGSAQEEARLLEEYISLYAPLTGGHGTGADTSYRAEMLFYLGDLGASEILAYKALYVAREKKQTAVELPSLLLLGNIAICKGDKNGWQSVVDSLSSAYTKASVAIRSMIDAIRGILILELTHPDNIADWLREGHFERLTSLPHICPFAHFVHAQYLCRVGEFARLIAFEEIWYPNGIEASPLLDALMSLAAATAHLNMGDKEKANMLVQRAADSTLPDGLVYPLLSYIQLLGGLLEPVVKSSYPYCLPAFLKIKKQLHVAGGSLSEYIVTVVKTVGLPDILTPREREVALLAAQGLRNAEISRRLSITENTVRYHLRSVFDKLDVDRRIRLAEKLS